MAGREQERRRFVAAEQAGQPALGRVVGQEGLYVPGRLSLLEQRRQRLAERFDELRELSRVDWSSGFRTPKSTARLGRATWPFSAVTTLRAYRAYSSAVSNQSRPTAY